MNRINVNNFVKNFTRSILFSFLLCGCLSDEFIAPINFEINHTAELLSYLEEHGDYINTTFTYSLISAEEVYNSFSQILILDIRAPAEYGNGHIDGAINLSHTELLNYINNVNLGSYNKIVIVCSTGQSATYYTTLLRLLGMDNIYALKFGMASWNSDFANIWLNVIEEDPIKDETIIENFTNLIWDRNNSMIPLPSITVGNQQGGIEQILEERISTLLNEDFYEIGISSSTTISLEQLYRSYNSAGMYFNGIYIICSHRDLYFFDRSGELTNPGHPPSTVLYNLFAPWYDLRSTLYLQTLPTNKTLVIYDFNGHTSAAYTAYLRLLGYDVKSLLFGYHIMIYSRLLEYPEAFSAYTFTAADIKDYPYIK